ncbi:leucine-rich repeat, cysteine-containing subtype protein [Tanacetum coccineum]
MIGDNLQGFQDRDPTRDRFRLCKIEIVRSDRDHDYDIQITPWIQQLALEFRCLKEFHIRRPVVCDEDLETLARTCGNDLRILKIKKCKGFSTDGLMHVSKYCNQLRTLCLKYCYHIEVKDDIWIHQLALNSMVLKMLHVRSIDLSNNAQELTLLAKNCCNSLISLKIGECYLSKLGDAFRYAVRLEQFGGVYICDEESELVGFQFPPNLHLDEDSRCLLFKRCPNLKVLHTKDVCGDRGLQVIGHFCKKLRKLTHKGVVTHVGLIALAKGCTNLESLKVGLGDVSNESLECVGTHLKNLRDFCICLGKEDSIIDLPLDNGVRAMLMGCSKLERLVILLRHGGLTDVGLEHIGKHVLGPNPAAERW